MSGYAAKPGRAWQRMLSGRRLDLLDPSPLDIEITDIAHGLARVARWNGQTRGAHIFSVAQHSVLVEEMARLMAPETEARALLAVLLHDGAEYVVGDIISPFKAALGDAYRAVEERIQRAIHLRFGLPPAPAPRVKGLIKRADRACAYFEATGLAGFSREEADRLFGKPPDVLRSVGAPALEPLSAEAAEASFLARFNMLSTVLDISASGKDARP